MSKFVRSGLTAASLVFLAGAAGAQDVFPFTDEGSEGPGNGPWDPPAIVLPIYTLTEIDTLGGLESYATAINDSGQVVGGAKIASGVTKAFRRTDGLMANLGSLPGLAYSSANAINEHGDVVGVAAAASNLWGSTAKPWIVRGTTWTNLDPFDMGVYATATGISDAGVVVGTNSFVGAGTLDSFRWTTGLPSALPRLAGDTCRISYGTGLNNFGEAVGFTAQVGDCGSNQAVRYVNNQALALPGLGGDNTTAEAISDLGDIVGTAELSTGQNRAMLWRRNGEVTNLGTLAGSSFALNVNNEGNVVGYYIDTRSQQRAFVSLHGNFFDLNGLITQGTGWRLLIATDINNHGQIVGQGRNAQGRLRGFILTPPCRSDFNRDGGIDGGDVESFYESWAEGQDAADMNMDGGVDGMDVEQFFELWAEGRC